MIEQHLRQILAELGNARTDLAILTAAATRLEDTLAAFLVEMRAMNSQHGPHANDGHELGSVTGVSGHLALF